MMDFETCPSASVTAIIPARNAGKTLRACLASLAPMVADGQVRAIVVVDDGSTDETSRIACSAGVRVLRGEGGGPGVARNLGWKSAADDLIWFLDADCVVRPDSLQFLVSHFRRPCVAAASGSYANALPGSWNARLIQAEIAARHGGSPAEVAMLGSYSMLCRRSALEAVGGFDAGLATGEDADLSYRLRHHGWTLVRDPRSIVAHFHETRFSRYLARQAAHGFNRVSLHRRFPGLALGDGYTGASDLAGLIAGLLWVGAGAGALLARDALPFALGTVLVLIVHSPMAMVLTRRRQVAEAVGFPLWAAIRSVARGFGAIRALTSRTARAGSP